MVGWGEGGAMSIKITNDIQGKRVHQGETRVKAASPGRW